MVSVKSLSRIFKALSDETRLTILALVLRHGHLCVCEVEQILGITQSKASRHLRYLRDAGLMEDEREGLIVNYRLPRDPDADVATVLESVKGLVAESAFAHAGAILMQIRAARERWNRVSDIRPRGPRDMNEQAHGHRHTAAGAAGHFPGTDQRTKEAMPKKQ